MFVIIACPYYVEESKVEVKPKVIEKNRQIDSLKIEIKSLSHENGKLKKQMIEKEDSLKIEIKKREQEKKELEVKYQSLISGKLEGKQEAKKKFLSLSREKKELEERLDKNQAKIKSLTRNLKIESSKKKDLIEKLKEREDFIQHCNETMEKMFIAGMVLVLILAVILTVWIVKSIKP